MSDVGVGIDQAVTGELGDALPLCGHDRRGRDALGVPRRAVDRQRLGVGGDIDQQLDRPVRLNGVAGDRVTVRGTGLELDGRTLEIDGGMPGRSGRGPGASWAGPCCSWAGS